MTGLSASWFCVPTGSSRPPASDRKPPQLSRLSCQPCQPTRKEPTMSLALVCMSHSPLLEYADPPADVTVAVDGAFENARAFVAYFDPTLVVSFAPDHYNGFFYDLMPPFWDGSKALSVGD